ncbi:MAG: response regulator, partial [Deltaproteobacteria bacterium]|nr:response regulator [Deltaproteobacteria bacterium]
METSEKDGNSGKKILVVDDEPLVRRTIRDIVESMGYSCSETDSARAALELVDRTHFPIVILDIAMPEMNGLELLKLIRREHPDTDVLIITGYQDRYSPLRIVRSGASDYLVKPFTVEQLAAKLYKIEREKALKEKLYLSSITDELTGLYNRRFFYQ